LEKKMDEVTLKTDLVNAILQYLGNQKFVDVAPLIQAIQQAASEQAASPVERVAAEVVN
jgi:hypothetical protein